MTTEVKTEQPNWREKRLKALDRGCFTYEEKSDATDWLSGPCGQLDPRLLRKEDGEPFDSKLRTLGFLFGIAVVEDDFETALDLLNKIEYREGELIAELSKRGEA